MSEEHNPDETEEPENHASVNRRSFVKALGAASGAAVFGASSVGNAFATETTSSSLKINTTRDEVPVSDADIKNALEHEESKIALKEASFKSLNRDKADGYEIKVTNGTTRMFHEVVVPSTGREATFSYVKSDDTNNVASIKTKTETLIRATARDDEIQTEILEFGENVTTEVLQTLEQSGKKAEIEKTGVSTLHTDKAATSFDKISETTYLYIPATMETDEKALVYAEIPLSGNPDSVYVIQQSYLECLSACVALQATNIGWFCWTYACGACVAGILPSCPVCIGCAGGIGGGSVWECAVYKN